MPRNEIHEVHAHVEALRRACHGFPVGEVADGQPGIEPDIIITGDQVVGIEHTRYSRRDEHGKDTLRQQEGEHEEVLRLARPIVEQRLGPLDADVQVIWTDSRITRSRRQRLAAGLADAISERLTMPSPDRFGFLDCDSAIATHELWEVFAVQIAPRLGKTPTWGSPAASMVPDLSPATIQEIIDRKNRKVQNYVDRHRYAALWLLIVAEGDRASAFFELPPTTRARRFQARFDRVVFFDIFNRMPIDLFVA
jgi:hypothetical protein